jgi:RNA polymerase sigma factor (sigma-70 family)
MEPLVQKPKHSTIPKSLRPTILSIESRSIWSPENWEQYLQEMEPPLRESLLPHYVWAKKIGKQYDNLFSDSQDCASEDISELAQLYLSALTERQVDVLRLIYWENKSEREVAHRLKISRSSVRTIHRRALLRCNKYFQETEFKFKQN